MLPPPSLVRSPLSETDVTPQILCLFSEELVVQDGGFKTIVPSVYVGLAGNVVWLIIGMHLCSLSPLTMYTSGLKPRARTYFLRLVRTIK